MTLLRKIKNHLRSERGVGVVEIILILVVLIGLVIIFKDILAIYYRLF